MVGTPAVDLTNARSTSMRLISTNGTLNKRFAKVQNLSNEGSVCEDSNKCDARNRNKRCASSGGIGTESLLNRSLSSLSIVFWCSYCTISIPFVEEDD